MKEFYEIMINTLHETIEYDSNLPTYEEIHDMEVSTKEDGTQLPWAWIQSEIDRATDWISLPSNRVRFLRARCWDLELAKKMMIDAVEWRRTFQGKGVHAISVNDIENEIKSGKAFSQGYDKEGRLISYVISRHHDNAARDLNEVQMFCVWMIERDYTELSREDIHRSCIIFDLGQFALRNMDYQFMKFMIHMLQNYYPDTLGVALILNSPWLFSGCWTMLKMWIDPASQKKVNFLNQAQLTDYIDKSVIPACYGGTNTEEYNPSQLLSPPITKESSK